MDNEKVTVMFANDPIQATTDTQWNGPEEQNKAKPEPKTLQSKDILMTQYAFDLGRQVAGQVVGRIGAYTGNYIVQNQINNLSKLIDMGSSVMTSLITGNPLPALTMAMNIGVSMMDYYVSVEKANITSRALLSLSGNSSTSGSRGGGRKV